MQLTGNDLGYYHSLLSLSEHNKGAVILYLLPYLINPPRGKNIGKRSIREKQKAFFLHVELRNDLHDAVQRRRNICATEGTTL